MGKDCPYHLLPVSMMEDTIVLIGGGACPEQYDAKYAGRQVGYLRLRHGRFTVVCPDVGGELVYMAFPAGDGEFEDDERAHYIQAARNAVWEWIKKRDEYERETGGTIR